MKQFDIRYCPLLRPGLRLLLVLPLSALFTATAQGQTQKISLTASCVTVGQIVAAIESQTIYSVAFDGTRLDTTATVTLASAEPTLRQALDGVVAGRDFTYNIMKRYIVISSQPRNVAQAVPVDVAPTGDRYVRSNPDEINAKGRRRLLPPPVVEIVDTTSVQADPNPNGEVPEFTSNIVSPGDYLAPGLSSMTVKTNLLYTGVTLTPNLAFEVGAGRRSTVELSGSWNQWNRQGDERSNKKLNHYIVRSEYRYWFCERFTGHFIGGGLFGGQFNISQHDISLLDFKKEHRYKGYMYGAGVVYGYSLPLARRWSVEFHVGVGVAQLEYKRYACAACSRELDESSKTYFGPTRAGVSLVFTIK